MRKGLLHLALLVAIGLVVVPVSRAQKPAPKPVPTAAALKKNLAALAASIEGENDAQINLMDKTGRQLLAYLKTHEVSAAAAKNLGLGYLDSQDATHLKLFSYSYSSGGTRGEVNRTVLQWQNQAGQLFAYAAHEEGSYGEIYKLASPGRTQYLLLGNEQGSSICLRGIAWLIELKGNYLLLDDKAFASEPTVDICNVEITYEARRRTLTVAAADNGIDEADVYAAHLGHPFKPFKLYFSQGRFVKKK